MLVKTDLRIRPVAVARDISYQPTAPITANDVQEAIDQLADIALLPGGTFPKTVTFAMSPYTPLVTETVLAVDTSGGAVVIQLPLAAARLTATGYVPVTVKKDDAGVNAVSVLPAGAELIDGLAAYPVDSAYTAVTFQPKAGGYDAI